MRMMLKVTIPVEAGNAAIADGSLPGAVMQFVEKMQPEASYFIAEGGVRTALFFFDMKDSSNLPSIAEPFFTKLKAGITVTPAMDLADMKAGVERAMTDS